MTDKKQKFQKLPTWFDGEIYSQGAVVTNRFSGESVELNALELSIYDFIMGCNDLQWSGVHINDKTIKLVRKGIDWFIKNNIEAYMILLD